MTGPVVQAVIFDAPLVNPSTPGLYGATSWTETTGPPRWLSDGVEIRPWNYGGEDAFGVWDQPWCADPGSDDSLKTGTRPDQPDPFAPTTVWAYDECDLTAPSRAEVRTRAQQVLRLQEQTAVERTLAGRLLTDASVIASRDTFREAVAYLEGEIAKTDTTAFIHAGAQWASIDPQVIFSSGGALRTELGHRLVFGGGYVEGLGDVLVATSPTFGWRDAVQVRETTDAQRNTFAVVAERSVVVGYEQLIAAVTVAVGSS